jgi:hypothetical protein
MRSVKKQPPILPYQSGARPEPAVRPTPVRNQIAEILRAIGMVLKAVLLFLADVLWWW